MTIRACPREIREAILCYLPLNTADIVRVALASKSLFADSLLNSAEFAGLHIRFQFKVSQEPELWHYLDKSGIKGDIWRSLPFKYKIGLMKLLLTVPDWTDVVDGLDIDTNLMHCYRWHLDPKDGDKILEILMKDPSFDVTAWENRPFRWSARLGYINTVKKLLINPLVDPTALDHYALSCCPDIEQPEIVKLLLADPRMSPTTRDHLGYSWACEKNHIETVHLFLSDSRIDPGYNENESLSALLKHGLSSIVKNLLLEGNRVDPSLGRYTLIRSAAAYGLTDLVELLLKDPRVDPSAETSSALALAAGHGHLECVQVLMKDGRSDPSTFDDYAIRRASENGFYKVVELLLTDIRVNPAAHDNTPLRKSVENGHIEIVRLLMRCHQVKPFVLRDAELLLLAGERNHINILELFLSDPRMSSLWLRDSAINSAAEQGIVVVVKRMMDFPGELNLSQAFCSAIRGGHVTVVETLMNSNRFENRNLVAGITLMVKERSLFFNSKIARLIIGHRGFIAHDGKAVNGVDKMTDDEMYQVLRQYVEAPEVNEILERFLRSEYL